MSALNVPHLTDGVVLLRLPAKHDTSAIFAACQDPEIRHFTAMPDPYELHHATEWIASAPEAWRNRTATPMVVIDATTGELLGACGLVEMSGDHAEIGYWVKREARRRGVASRAVRIVTDWALSQEGLTLIELLAGVDNLASQRVAEKAGFTRDGEVPPPARCAGRFDRMVRFVCVPQP